MTTRPVDRALRLAVVLCVTGGPAVAQRTSDLRAEAFRLYDAGQFREAIPPLDVVLGRKHRDIEAHMRRGNSLLRLDQPERALADFDGVIRFAPYFPSPYTDRGIANLMLGRLDAARGDFGRAIDLFNRPILGAIDNIATGDINSSWNLGGFAPPVSLDKKGRGRAIAHGGLGQVYQRSGQHEQAVDEYNQAIRLNPADPNFQAGRGDAYAALGQPEQALVDYNEAIRLDPNHPHALARRGEAWSRQGETDLAMADFDRALRINPDDVHVRRLRVALLSRLDHHEKALQDLDAGVRDHPDDSATWKDRGGVLVRMGRYEEAIKDLDRAIALDPRRASSYVNRGAAFNSLGRYDRAIRDLDEAIRLDPRNAAAYTNRGRAAFAIGGYERAIEDLGAAVRLDPGGATVRYNRAETYARLGRLDEAVVDYDEAIRLAPGFALAHVGLGNALDTLGKSDRAIEEYSMALRLAPSDVGIYRNRGDARRSRGDWDGAIADFTRVIELDPRHADAYVSRGWSRLVAGRGGASDDARTYLDMKRGDDKNAAYMAILGALAARRDGRTAEADVFLDEANANTSPRAWPAPVLRYLRGTGTAPALFDAAGDVGQKIEAHTFLGVDLLFAGDPAGAAEHLRWVLRQADQRNLAIDLARETLRRVGDRGTTHAPAPSPLP